MSPVMHARRTLAALLLAAAPLAAPAVVGAQTIDFDDLSAVGLPFVPNGYKGFDWTGLQVLDVTNNPFTPVSASSPPNVVYPNFGFQSEFSLAGPGTFTLGSIDFAQWAPFGGAPATTTHLSGYLGATQLFQMQVQLQPTPTTTVLNWSGINRVVVDQLGFFVADDVVIGAIPSAVPEPATVGLLAAGLGALGAVGAVARRRPRA